MRIKDGDWELESYDPASGQSVWHLFDGEKHIWRTDTPIDDLIDQNKAEAAAMRGHRRADGVGDKIASIPLDVAFEKLNEAILQGDRAYVRRWLNDSDNAKFRVREGKV